jgi:malonyl CoA-acyl carrier protein transacylase
MSRDRPLEIAIVGMGCRLPGAPDLFAYWERILAGRAGASDPAAPGPAPVSEAIEAALSDASLTPAAMEDLRVATLDALDLAMRALAPGEADLAIVAGDVAEADGRHSGTAALVLKRLADAERDGDRIYAVAQEVIETASYSLLTKKPSPDLTGLIQAALALYHRVRPPDLHAARPWIHADPAVPRRVSVDASLAGPYAHVVLEEHAASADAEADTGNPGAMLHWETEAILLSAPDRAGLADRVRELIAWLEGHPRSTLKDIAYTLNGDEDQAGGVVRLGLVATSPADLASRLGALLPRLDDPSRRAIGDGRGTYYWDEPHGGSGGLAFLFPGEGSQYPGMLADLCLHFPEVRRLFETSDRIALEQGDAVPPSEYLFARASRAAGDAELWSAPTAVNVVLSAQWALFQVLTRLGLRPDAVAGHSSGELLALAAAGVLETDRHLERQLAELGSIFRGLESAGDVPAARLVAVAAGRDRAEAACRAVDATGVVVAIDNCPHQVVLAGPPAEVERVAGRLREENILLEDLPFQRAYHTPAFEPVLGPVASFFKRLNFGPPRILVYSCAARGRMPRDPEAIRELAVSQWTRTVAFRETVEAMHADGLRIFVDVGARGNLAGFVQDTLRGRPAFAIATNLPRRSGPTQLNHLVAALFAQGVPIRPGFLYARRRPRRIAWHAPETPARSLVEIPLGIPEMRSSELLPASLSLESRLQAECDHPGPAEAGTPAIALLESRLRAESDPSGRQKPGLQLPRSHGVALDLRNVEAISDRFSGRLAGPVVPVEVDAAMLAFQDTMRAFLETQQAVIGAYLASSPADPGAHRAPYEFASHDMAGTIRSGPEPGPWVGDVRRLVPGSEIEAVLSLDAESDPIAEHHTLGGRRVSALDPLLKGLPVLPFAVMAEMTAQAAALIVSPGLVLARLERLWAHKWVRYEVEPILLELRGHREPSSDPGEERVWVGLFNRGPDGRADAQQPVFEAVAVFAGSTPPPPPAGPWFLDEPRPSRFTAESLYGEQWLFHGPAFRALVEVGKYSGRGIDGVLRVLPWEPLIGPDHPARLHTDLIVLDSFTHLLGCWGLDYLADHGDVVFPLRMEALHLYGGRPPVGTDVACRIAVEEMQRHRVHVSAEIIRPDGSVWMRLHDWEDWRFHWPSRYRDVFRQPQDIFIGEELSLDVPDEAIKAIWLAPPADMGRPVWRDVLEQTQLGPAERAEHLAMRGPENRRSHRLWGRIAAKEAARRIWRDEGCGSTYPADLAVVPDGQGGHRLIRLDDPGDPSLPSIAIADAEGVAVAIAARDPRTRPGIAVAPIGETEGSLLAPDERALLARWAGPEHLEWAARFRCAQEAAARSARAGYAAGPHAAEVIRLDQPSGVLHVRVASSATRPLRVATVRRGEYTWAWTIGSGAES